MIVIKSEIKHGGPQSENGGIWPPGKYSVGDRTMRDFAAKKQMISEGLAQFFIMQEWAEDDEGILRGHGQPKGQAQATVQPAGVRQPGRAGSARAR